MIWLILVGLIVVGFFVLNGIKTRCPNCGFYGLNPKDNEREAKQKESYESRSSLGGMVTEKPGYANRNFVCKKCGHGFSRKISTGWLRIENKLGKDIAI